MTSYERIVYRDAGKVKTVTLRNVVQSAWTLAGTRVNGHGQEIESSLHENGLTINLKTGIITRTVLHMNAAGTHLEER